MVVVRDGSKTGGPGKVSQGNREPPSRNEEALFATFYTSQIILNQYPGLG